MLNRKELLNLIFVVVLLIGIPFAVSLIRQQQILRSRAAINPIVFSGPNVKSIADSTGVQKLIATAQNVELQLTSTLSQLLPSPTVVPTAASTAVPTQQPTANPTAASTAVPTQQPTANPTAASTAVPIIRSPSVSIWAGEAGVKSTITDNENLIINFNRNTDVNAVNLVIDGAEEGPPTQVTLPLTGGGAQITWPNTHSKHTPGSHTVGIKGYFCPNLSSNDPCTGSGTDTRTVTITTPSAISASCNSNNRATLTWSAVSGASHYIIRINKDPGVEWSPEWTDNLTTVTAGDRAFNSGNTNTVTVNLSAGNYPDWSATPSIGGQDKNDLKIDGDAFVCSGS